MPGFVTALDYITEARGLAQDTDGIRYPLSRVYAAMNAALTEAYRLRPDFFRGLDAPPAYGIGDDNTTINWPRAYSLALIYYMVGHLELTDAEGNLDARAAALSLSFTAKLSKPAV